MKIYSLYSLCELSDIAEMRYIGITSQTLSKRISDIVACSKLSSAHGFNSKLSCWCRYLNDIDQRPIGKIHYENNELILVKLELNKLMHSIDNTNLLNAFLFQSSNVKINVIIKPESHHAIKTFHAKQFVSENKDLTDAELQSKRMKACWEARKKL